MDYLKKLYTSIRNSENNKLLFWNTIGAFIVKGGGMLLSLFSMPAYIAYFDNQVVLGLWFTMLSVLSWILTFDLGIGNGLRNNLVPLLVKKDRKEIKHYISSSYIVIGLLVALISGVSLVVFRFLNWNVIFNISETLITKEILYTAVSIVFVGIMLHFLLKLVESILYAAQRSAINNLISLISRILLVIYLFIPNTLNLSEKLIALAIVHLLSVNLPLLFVTLSVFLTKLKFERPSVKYYSHKHAKDILTLGGKFFWVQIMYMLITTTNEFLITWLSDPSYVVEYQIYYRLFTLVGTLFTLALTPVWSAVTKAISEDNLNWIIKLYSLLKKITLVAVLFEFLMILLLQFGIDIWLGSNAIDVEYIYGFAFAIYGSIFIWNSVLSSIANGLGELKTQTISYTLGVILKFPLAYVLVNYFDSWIGVVIANIIAMSIYSVVQPIIFRKNGLINGGS